MIFIEKYRVTKCVRILYHKDGKLIFYILLPTLSHYEWFVGSLLYHQHHIFYTSTFVVREWFPLIDEVWNGKLFLYRPIQADENSENHLIMILSLPIFYLGIFSIPRQNWFWSLFENVVVSFLFVYLWSSYNITVCLMFLTWDQMTRWCWHSLIFRSNRHGYLCHMNLIKSSPYHTTLHAFKHSDNEWKFYKTY